MKKFLSICLFISTFLTCVLLLNAQFISFTVKKGPPRSKVTTSKEWITKSVEAHNYFRSLHHAPPLVLSNTLSEISQNYANVLLSKAVKSLSNSGDGNGKIYFEHNPAAGAARIGENLYYSVTTHYGTVIQAIPPQYAVTLWYEEIKDYDFATATQKRSSDSQAMIGHLTQLLWKDTREMGTAYASAKIGNQTVTFVVANYYEGGNLVTRGDNNDKQYYLKNVFAANLSDSDIKAAIVSQQVIGWWPDLKVKSSTPESWSEAALKTHNTLRESHKSVPLRLNKNLCKVSQKWAETLLEDGRGLTDFNSRGVINSIQENFIARLAKFGESSMYFLTGEKTISPEMIVKLWYRQRKYYDFEGSIQPKGKTEKFQQIVWNDTTEFCISYATGLADNGQYLTYVVANYYPAISDRDIDRKRNVITSAYNPALDEEEACCSVGTIIGIVIGVIISAGTVIFILVQFYKKRSSSPFSVGMKTYAGVNQEQT